MTGETHFDCPICNNHIPVENMMEHIMNHLEKECNDFSLTVNKK